ncbi:MAG: hypothetical protein Q7T73_05590 [Beijerinckiaceae bacterium]|nr:hypothetical protein [Beijerinckiaceae bacterium]
MAVKVTAPAVIFAADESETTSTRELSHSPRPRSRAAIGDCKIGPRCNAIACAQRQAGQAINQDGSHVLRCRSEGPGRWPQPDMRRRRQPVSIKMLSVFELCGNADRTSGDLWKSGFSHSCERFFDCVKHWRMARQIEPSIIRSDAMLEDHHVHRS